MSPPLSPSRPSPPRLSPLRLLTTLFGLTALAWSASTLPLFSRATFAETISGQIIDAEPFKEEVLIPALARVEADTAIGPPASPAPLFVRAASLLRLRLAEVALDKADPAAIDPRLEAATAATRASLRAAPADPFAWLTLFWLANTREGFAPDHLKYLALSYRFGPREGWIAQRRNRLALVVFDRLDAPLQEAVVKEFAGLVDSGLVVDAEASLTGPGWPVRDRLLAGLADVDIKPKLALSKKLAEDAVRVSIPGVEQEERPWFR